jgi:hypothetical protein
MLKIVGNRLFPGPAVSNSSTSLSAGPVSCTCMHVVFGEVGTYQPAAPVERKCYDMFAAMGNGTSLDQLIISITIILCVVLVFSWSDVAVAKTSLSDLATVHLYQVAHR